MAAFVFHISERMAMVSGREEGVEEAEGAAGSCVYGII
jgi:hypothetical protein